MVNERFAMILQMKVSGLVEALMHDSQLTLKQALHLVYHSQCYQALSEESTKLWHQSPFFLLELIQDENKTGYLTWPDE